MSNKSALLYIGLIVLLTNCRTDSKKIDFLSSLEEGDTLTLSARLSDCGEWGGHHENIYLYKKKGELWANYYEDSIHCKDIPYSYVKIKEFSEEVTFLSKRKIEDYINKIGNINQIDLPVSNGANSFKIISKDTTIEVLELHNNWFSDLKQNIFEDKF